jgi:hypothetical protein
MVVVCESEGAQWEGGGSCRMLKPSLGPPKGSRECG